MSHNTGNQCIHCNVESCAYNNVDQCFCTLSEITVEPNCDCDNGKPSDESNCSNYARKDLG